ncbi:caspase family protein [Roseovarius sp. Pro17]|uniref:caspase family protein n=1 Tax=Roseovarius sp. Pro17 TaxID=3108175 RepID=UPI002D772D9C|nr:caspase family protein [Roseovarius sp. Pro17]
MIKITLEELSQKMAEPGTQPEDLAPYFIEDVDASDPFAPAITLNPDRVVIPDTDDAATRSALLLNGANWIERQSRQARFFRRLSKGDYKGPIIVEEGDSWFQFPILLRDTIDVLMEEYAVFSLSAGGDTLANMAARAEYRKAIEQTGATILLLSGGGNDLVADGDLSRHLRKFNPDLAARDYLLPSFDQLVATALGQFDRIYRDVAARYPKVRILCHGYDFAVPNKGKWLGKPMIANGIKDARIQVDIAKIMMDRFNDAMAGLARRHSHVTFLNLRGTVGGARWHDELHPTNEGYRDVAKQFSDGIKALGHKSRGASTPSSVSLHVGLNKVDQGHYGGGLIDLDFCVADADAMDAIAHDGGFANRTQLKDHEATRDAIIEACADAAKTLKAGDIFMFSYAGHGGQVKDFNDDESGGPDRDILDETLCLYDAQLIDDELYKIWSDFAEGVRVLAVFDCCHSGSMLRASVDLAAQDGPTRGKTRMMPLAVAAQVFRNNADFYRSLPSSQPGPGLATPYHELTFPVAASVLQVSACQSNQKAQEDLGNGLFTASILETLAETSDPIGYKAFRDRCAARMPTWQSPNFWSVGRPDPAFEGQRVFSV